jgi:hypothetical protein
LNFFESFSYFLSQVIFYLLTYLLSRSMTALGTNAQSHNVVQSSSAWRQLDFYSEQRQAALIALKMASKTAKSPADIIAVPILIIFDIPAGAYEAEIF